MGEDNPSVYGLVGFPLGHSFSRRYFSGIFEREKIRAEYVNFELPSISGLPGLIASTPGLKGFNVTIPYKQAVIPYLDRIDRQADAIGAVNVVKVEPDGTLTGYNSDIDGFVGSIRRMLDGRDKKALVLGTGGASRAVLAGLGHLGLSVSTVSRRPGKGDMTYADLTPEIISRHKVIVNATPVGMYPNVDACPEIPYEALDSEHVCFDLVYNPSETLFMKKAAEKGAKVKNGYEMLILQAERAREIWSGF